jgi:PleD family two-component response regulator
MDRPQSKQILLIVDANPENINVLKTMLSSDYDIKVVADGEEAIRLALSPDTPGLILLNTMMPTAEMYEVCRKLKADKNTKDIPIICLSEPTTEDTEAKGFDLGAADYITKPFKRSVVKARVRTHLELKRYRDNLENSEIERVSRLDEKYGNAEMLKIHIVILSSTRETELQLSTILWSGLQIPRSAI